MTLCRIGISHARWATHGRVNENDAHPHAVDGVAVVHNGIIENHRELRNELKLAGACFVTDTDTEVIAHLVNQQPKMIRSMLLSTIAKVNGLELG